MRRDVYKRQILFWRYAGEEAAQAAKPTDVESLWKSNYEVAEEWRDTEIRKAEEENANKTVEEEKQPTNEHMVDKKPKSDIIKEEKNVGTPQKQNDSSIEPDEAGLYTREKIFESPDRYVGELATSIEKAYPGTVVAVNKIVRCV